MGATAACAATVAFSQYLRAREPSHPIARSLTFWTAAVPPLLHYRFVHLTTRAGAEREAALERLHEGYANRVLDTIVELRGFYIKIGQVLATRSDFLPRVWIEKMRTLEDAVPPRPLSTVSRVLEAELGQPLEAVFSEFDERPLGSASIGQVHRARVRATNEIVAVKIQFEEAEDLFRGDIANMKLFCRVAQPEQVR